MTRRRRSIEAQGILLASALFALTSCASAPRSAPRPAPAASFTDVERAAQARVHVEEISAHIRFLSDDLLEGRFPGTRGDELATRYLASQLESIGLSPGVPGRGDQQPSWFQPVPLVRHVSAIPPEVVFRRGRERLALATGPGKSAEVVLHSLGDTDRVHLRAAELVFVGYGIVAPEHGWDDYRGVDVRGKVVVLLNFNPPFAGEGVRLWYGRWDYKYLEAVRHGAAGALLVHTTESAGYPWQVVTASTRPEAFALPPDIDPHLSFEGWIERGAAARLFRMARRDLAAEEAREKDPSSRGGRAAALGVTLSLDMPVRRERVESANVLGVLPGTDPQLRGELVVYTAHHDHLGVRSPPVAGQRNVYAGALDNASGCASVLAIARAAAAAPPRRSVLFLFTTAEEQGLLGSRWFATHPTVPAGRIAADINLDSVNKWGRTTDVGMVGLGKSTLDAVVRDVAAAQGRTVHGDPFPDRGSFYRSDQFELAKAGVPVVAVRGGPSHVGRPPEWGKQQIEQFERHDYHQPTDTFAPESWDLGGAVEDAQLQLVVGLRVANAPGLPTWTPGDEFEKARRQTQK